MAFIELVTWKKHQEGSSEFVEAAQVPAQVEVVLSIGIAVTQTDDVLVLAQSLSEAEGKYSNPIVIPKSAIISRKFKEHTAF